MRERAQKSKSWRDQKLVVGESEIQEWDDIKTKSLIVSHGNDTKVTQLMANMKKCCYALDIL